MEKVVSHLAPFLEPWLASSFKNSTVRMLLIKSAIDLMAYQYYESFVSQSTERSSDLKETVRKGAEVFFDLLRLMNCTDEDLREEMVTLFLEFARVNYCSGTETLAKNFLRLGCDSNTGSVYEGKEIIQRQFFADALGKQPQSEFLVTHHATIEENSAQQEVHCKIAMSLCVLSMLCYREDSDIKYTLSDMDGENEPMFLSSHTEWPNTNLSVFIERNLKWAVFCFRGTEFEKPGDFLTSLEITNGPLGTESSARIRGMYNLQLLNLEKFKIPDSEGHENNKALEVIKEKGNKVSSSYQISERQLVEALAHSGCKTYYTGHSMGGGLATLFGGKWASQFTPTAIVSFGATPVGNKTFCENYNKDVKVSWRFVNGNEFSPMVPPLPFMEQENVLMHVHDCYRSDDCFNKEKARTREQVCELLKNLTYRKESINMVRDHNPMYHMEALKKKLA